jgi:N6-adenosine-specific RNA methylase IME4
LIDGHNRLKICNKHGIEYRTTEKQFDSRNDVLLWIIDNQLARRNLQIYDRTVLALKWEDIFARRAKSNQIRSGMEYGKGLQISAEPIKPVDTRNEIAKLAGVSHDTVHKVKTIEKKATPKQLEKIAKGEVSISKIYKDIKREEKRAEVKQDLKPAQIPEGAFDVIYADPPWQYEFSETADRNIENQYPTMELEKIKGLKVPSSDNAVLLLWATAPKLEEALEVLKAWGFKYRTCAVWDKEIIGMGYWFRGQHELLLVGVKGTYHAPLPENRFSSVIREKRGKHSKKPDLLYEMVETMFPKGKYLELFARENRIRWVGWGNQCD